MGKYTTYVGMDVHARSITAVSLNLKTGVTSKKHFGSDERSADVALWLSSLDQPLYCAYESGCTGFHLARDLREFGYDCDVIAVSTLARSTKDKQGKCDKLDARAILREIVNPMRSFNTVWIPSEEEEGRRELVRLYHQTISIAKDVKLRLRSFLMLHGYVWSEKTKTGKLKKPTGRAYETWLKTITFESDTATQTFKLLCNQMTLLKEEVARIKEAVDALARTSELKPYVDAFCAIKGIGTVAAVTAKVEMADPTRFKNARSVPAWLGVVPVNFSSGEKQCRGAITKAGNKYLRKTLTESVAGIAMWSGSPAKSVNVSGVSANVEAMACKANIRLRKKYLHLKNDLGKHSNKCRMAVVNELSRWLWVIGCEVKRSMETKPLT